MKIASILKKSILILIGIVVLVLILAQMSGAFREKIEPGKTDAEHRELGEQATYKVARIAQPETVEVVGTLVAERRTDIASRIMATILEMNVRAGDRVAKGDVLVRLDDRDLKAQVEQARQGELGAEANVQKARQGQIAAIATAENAKKQFARVKSLLDQGVASKQEYDQSEEAWKLAQSGVKQADEAYNIAQTGLKGAREAKSFAETFLSYSVIKAPMAGVVVDTLADVGDTPAAGRALLSIYDPATLQLEAAVPEALAQPLKEGLTLSLQIGALGAGPTTGTIREIVPQTQAASRSQLVKIKPSGSLAGLVEGAFARLLIPSQERVRLCLALSAVERVGQLTFVDVVTTSKTLERRMVRLGEHSRMERVEVLSGLKANEQVVLYGPTPPPMPKDISLFEEGVQ